MDRPTTQRMTWIELFGGNQGRAESGRINPSPSPVGRGDLLGQQDGRYWPPQGKLITDHTGPRFRARTSL